MEVNMSFLPAIGFGILVVSLRLIMLWRNMKGTANLRNEGFITIGVGLVAWLLGTFISSDTVLRTTGYSIMFIGFILLIQWIIQTGKGTLSQVLCWGLFTGILGLLLIIAYYIWVLFL
jgi:hypothetical protein